MSDHTIETGPARLERSRSDRMLAGVAGGLGAYFELHPAVFRVSFVVLTLMGGAGIAIYLVAALVMPDEGKDDSFATAALRRRRHRPWLLIALGLLSVVVLATLSEVPVWPQGDAWLFLLAAGALALWLTWYALGTARSGWLRALGILLATLAVVVLLAVAAVVAAFDVDLGNGADERTYVPAAAGELRDRYELGLGELEFDLRSVSFPPGVTTLDVRVDLGSVRVLLPRDVALRGAAEAKLGGIDLLGRRHVDGWKVEDRVAEVGTRVLVLYASVGLGEIEVRR